MAEKGPKKFSRFMRHFPTTRVPYRIRVAREEYKKLKPILEAKKEERGENEGG